MRHFRFFRQARRRCGLVRRNRSGAVAVEFALVAWPVFMCVIAIFEISIMTLQSVVLFGALDEAARQLRTGVIQKASDPQQAFEDAVCGGLVVLISCDEIVYDVRNYASFSGVLLNDLVLDGGGMPASDQTKFTPGGAGSITVTRVYSRYSFVTPFLGNLFNDAHGSRLISYTAVVKGEPWD